MIRLQTDISLPRRWWKIPDLRSASYIGLLRRYTYGCLCVAANEAVIPNPTTDNTLLLRLRLLPASAAARRPSMVGETAFI